MSNDKVRYEKKYQELRLLGRGAFGKAYLVKNLLDKEFYVSKKMTLDGLKESQTEGAWKQIEILKQMNELDSPFIVKYYETFFFENTLVIIIQYCEFGDLSNFLKKWKERGTLVDQKVVANWFIQLASGVKALHSKKVLHRDLKSANIFLTRNRTIKIGDFGISKILDSTNANTFTGTPYYLSPEVCNSQPYSYQADIWAMGCIIYELCTLTYPFRSGNICGLALKIITEEIEPISNNYSAQLRDIVNKLFIKDSKKRITIEQIFTNKYIRQKMSTFEEDWKNIQQLLGANKETIKIEAQPQQRASSNQQTLPTINSQMKESGTLDYSMSLATKNTLTPKERLKLKKQQENRMREEELKNATKKNAMLKDFAKMKKQETFSSSGAKFNNAKELQKEYQKQNKAKAEWKRTETKFLRNQQIDMSQLKDTLNKVAIKANNSNFEYVDMPNESVFLEHEAKIIKEQPQKPVEEEIEEDLQEYYDEEFEEYLQDESQTEFETVKAFYNYQVDTKTLSPSKKEKIKNTYKSSAINICSPNNKIDRLKDECKKTIGPAKYKQLYGALKENQIDFSSLKAKYSKEEQNAIMKLDQIIFLQTKD